jgi:hypothetical protein
VGDPKAKLVLKKEIMKRFADGNDTVSTFLIEQGYFEYLSKENKKLIVVELIERENFKALSILRKNMPKF